MMIAIKKQYVLTAYVLKLMELKCEGIKVRFYKSKNLLELLNQTPYVGIGNLEVIFEVPGLLLTSFSLSCYC